MTSRDLLSLLLATMVAAPALAQEQVARVKSAPQDYRGRAIVLQGEVVEIQALSPRSRQGVYRLLDATDAAGVLIRTSDLPQTGGPFRVRAALSPELLRNGQLLLDETSRQTLRGNSLPVALGLAALGLAAVLWAAAIYISTRRRERRMRLAPPLWLIPAAGDHPPEAQSHGTAQFDYKLQYVEEERSAHLEARKRRSLLALGPGLVVAIAGAAWAGILWRAEASQPAFVLLEPESVGGAPLVAAPPDSLAPRPDDTLRVVIQQTPPAIVTPGVADTLRRRRRPRPDSVGIAAQAAQPAPPRDTARAAVSTVVAAPETTVSTPPPPPPPAPEPEPERRVPETPAPDPAALRRAAEAELQSGIARFVAAVAAREAGTVATLYPAGGDTRRVRFLDFVRDSRPEASLRGVDAATVTENTAQAQFTISFRWRGEFGVARRKDAKFQASARRTGAGWAFDGARLLENMP